MGTRRTREKQNAARPSPKHRRSAGTAATALTTPLVGWMGSIYRVSGGDERVDVLEILEVERGADGLWQRARVRLAGDDQPRWISRRGLKREGKQFWTAAKRRTTGTRLKDPDEDMPARVPHGLEGGIPLGTRSVGRDESVLTVLASEEIHGVTAPDRLVATILIDEFRRHFAARPPGVEWVTWVGNLNYEKHGRTFCVAFSKTVPSAIVDSVEQLLRMFVLTSRGTANPARHDLDPLLWAGDDGLELLRMI